MKNMTTSNMSEVKMYKKIKRTEEYPAIVHESEYKPIEKKRNCKALPTDENNGNQQKKLSKNTAKKRRRAQQLETTICVQEIVEQSGVRPKTSNITPSNVVLTEMINVSDRSKNSDSTKLKINKAANQNVINVKTHEKIINNYAIQNNNNKKKVLKDASMPKSQTIGNGNCIIHEIDENLFNLPRDVALAHCIAEDLRMERGVAIQFKCYFGGIGQLMDQKLTVGNVGVVVKNQNENAFYMVTKKYCNAHSTILSLTRALKSLVEKMRDRKLTKLGIPQIGCGIDGLEWSKVKPLIEEIFVGSGIKIIVCVPTKIFYRPLPPQMKVFVTSKKLLEINYKLSDLVLLIDIDQVKATNFKNDMLDAVNSEYPSFKEKLMKDIKNKTLNPGDVTTYFIKKERINCLFTSKSAYYSSLEKGFIKINNYIRSNYRNFAIQSGPIKPNTNLRHITRIVLILRSIIYGSELWLCSDSDQPNEKEVYEHYCKKLFDKIRLSTKSTDRNNLLKGKRNTPTKNNLQKKLYKK